MSLRSSERGLKFYKLYGDEDVFDVAPFVGAWIEITTAQKLSHLIQVAPFVGAWIEISSGFKGSE